MNVVMVTINDPAGTGIEFKRALERHTPHRCRLITTEIRYNFMFAKDLHVPWLESFDELERVLAEADLFHFHMTADEHLPLGPFTVAQFHRGQPIVHHHHGEPPFRADPRRFAERELAQGRPAIVATPDLLRGYPEARWIPNTVPSAEPLYQPLRGERDADAVFVSHSPTRRELKDTETFLRVMGRLEQRHPHVGTTLIEHTPHLECLRLKQRSQVFFDHMQGYYGVSSLEALSQGVPTVAGLDAWNEGHMKRFAETDSLPFVVARDEAALERALEHLACDPDHRVELGIASRRFMEESWTAAKVARRLADTYEEVAGSRSAATPRKVAAL